MAVTRGVTRPRNNSSRTFARCSILDRKARGNDASPGPKVDLRIMGIMANAKPISPRTRSVQVSVLLLPRVDSQWDVMHPLGSRVICRSSVARMPPPERGADQPMDGSMQVSAFRMQCVDACQSNEPGFEGQAGDHGSAQAFPWT